MVQWEHMNLFCAGLQISNPNPVRKATLQSVKTFSHRRYPGGQYQISPVLTKPAAKLPIPGCTPHWNCKSMCSTLAFRLVHRSCQGNQTNQLKNTSISQGRWARQESAMLSGIAVGHAQLGGIQCQRNSSIRPPRPWRQSWCRWPYGTTFSSDNLQVQNENCHGQCSMASMATEFLA